MERKSLIPYGTLVAVLLFASTIAITVQPAHALVTISGNTKDGAGGFTVGYAKVSAEAAGSGNYIQTTSDAYGFWSMNVNSGVTYTVDGSKDLNGRGRLTGIVGPASNLVVKIPGQTQNAIEFLIVSDDDFRNMYGSGSTLHTAAKDKLFAAETYYRNQHNIKFTATAYYDTWNSNNSNLICSPPQSLLSEVESETGWSTGTHYGANVLWAISRIPYTNDAGGCGDQPSIGGQYPGSIVYDISPDLTEYVMHEISHNYGNAHITNTWYDIMQQNLSYIAKNWKPTGTDSSDDRMQLHRGWY